MIAQCITLSQNEISRKGYQALVKSSKEVKNDFEIEQFEAIKPGEVDRALKYMNLSWNWPEKEKQYDDKLFLWKMPYTTKVLNKRIACALSHYVMWQRIKFSKEPALILEHDAVFIRKFEEPDTEFNILGINDPRGATRKASLFHDLVRSNLDEYQKVPKIDSADIPQGIAGNSAYYMTPEGASRMIDLVLEHGVWPNDAIMCYQMYDSIGVSRTYYTKVQGLESTTSL